MSNGLATVASGLVGLAAMGALAAARARRGRPYLAEGLLLAVHGPDNPISTAVRAGYAGVEIGVYLDGAALRLACDMPDGAPGPRFSEVVLRPLVDLVDASPLGRVHARRAEPFVLMVHYEPGPAEGPVSPSPYRALDMLLRSQAPLFTTFLGGRVIPGAITVVLSGPHWSRTDLLGAYERFAFLEGHFGDLEPGGLPATVAPFITEAIGARLGWDPFDEWPEFPAEARHILRSLVRAAHDGGRRIRFVDVPEEPRQARVMFWQELRAAEADLIGSRHRGALARFLRRPANRSRKHRAVSNRYQPEPVGSEK